MVGFEFSNINARMLLNLILYSAGDTDRKYLTDNPWTECAYYPGAKKMIVINNADTEQTTKVETEQGVMSFAVPAYGDIMIDIG